MTEQRDAVLARSDLPMVREEILNLHRMFQEHAAKDGGKMILRGTPFAMAQASARRRCS